MLIADHRAFGAAVFVALVLATGAPRAAVAEQFDHAGLARSVLNAHIRPGYARLVLAATNMKKALATSCLPQTKAAKSARNSAFDRLIDAWGRIEHIQFGPITRETRLERILFWQDRRGRGARQVEQVIANRDQSVLDVNLLANRSVALQGIGALESVLYKEPTAFADPSSARFRCSYGQAIATNLATIAAQLQFDWSDNGDYAKLWLSAGPGNPQFLSPSETTLALAKAFDHGIERIRDTRIAGPLGLNQQRVRTPAVLSTSGRTIRLITANIEGIRELYIAGGLQRAITATNANESDKSRAKLVADELNTALKIARSLAPVANPFAQGKTAQPLVAMGFPLKNARDQAAVLLASTAGLSMGFNASDGD